MNQPPKPKLTVATVVWRCAHCRARNLAHHPRCVCGEAKPTQ